MEGEEKMKSIRTKFTLLNVCAILVTMSIATLVGVYSIRNLGRSDVDQLLHLKCTTGAMNLETYFDSVEHSVDTVATLIEENLADTSDAPLHTEVENTRRFFARIAANTHGVRTYYFRISPDISTDVKGFWYVRQDNGSFEEHTVTDISQYDTNDTSQLVWFTIPKSMQKGGWLPPYYTENLDVRVISYNVPIYWHDQFIGVAGIEIDYDTLAQEVEKIQLFEHGYAFILDENSNVIYHPQMDESLQYGEKIALDNPDQNIGEKHIQYNFAGVDKEAAWQPLSNGMRLYVTVPLDELNSGWHLLIWCILQASIIILLLVIFITNRFAKRFTLPLRKLTAAARQVASGNYDVKLEYHGNDEIGLLTQTFKQLVEQTKEHIQKLSQQVYTDPLTIVQNKAAYSAYINKLQHDLETSGAQMEFAIGVFDCDNLKYINDVYGHDKGDIYIQSASQLIRRAFPQSPVFRIGGDEFAVILEKDALRDRDMLFEQFRKYRDELGAAASDEWEQANVTMGLAVYDPQIDPSVSDVSRRADQCMYENKRLRKVKQRQPISTSEKEK